MAEITINDTLKVDIDVEKNGEKTFWFGLKNYKGNIIWLDYNIDDEFINFVETIKKWISGEKVEDVFTFEYDDNFIAFFRDEYLKIEYDDGVFDPRDRITAYAKVSKDEAKKLIAFIEKYL